MSDTYASRPSAGQDKDQFKDQVKEQAKDVAGQAKDFARDLKAKVLDVSDTVSRAAKDNASQLGDAALSIANTARDKVEATATQQKSVGADYIDSIARAAGRAANEFEADLPQAAHYIRQASEQVQGVANTVRESDMRELVGEVQAFARRQPTLFFGGAVVLGFAALRFLKSSAPSTGSESENGRSAFETRSDGAH